MEKNNIADLELRHTIDSFRQTEVGYFENRRMRLCDEDILRFEITVSYSFGMNML